MKVIWPGIHVNRVEIWKVLELAGMASSTRKAQHFVKSGYVYIYDLKVLSLKDTVEVEKPFELEIRFPSGIVVIKEITVVLQSYFKR